MVTIEDLAAGLIINVALTAASVAASIVTALRLRKFPQRSELLSRALATLVIQESGKIRTGLQR